MITKNHHLNNQSTFNQRLSRTIISNTPETSTTWMEMSFTETSTINSWWEPNFQIGRPPKLGLGGESIAT